MSAAHHESPFMLLASCRQSRHLVVGKVGHPGDASVCELNIRASPSYILPSTMLLISTNDATFGCGGMECRRQRLSIQVALQSTPRCLDNRFTRRWRVWAALVVSTPRACFERLASIAVGELATPLHTAQVVHANPVVLPRVLRALGNSRISSSSLYDDGIEGRFIPSPHALLVSISLSGVSGACACA